MATTAQTRQQIEEIEPFEAAQEIEGGDVVLIDTREPHEYQEAHLEGGKLVPPGLLGDEIAAAAPPCRLRCAARIASSATPTLLC